MWASRPTKLPQHLFRFPIPPPSAAYLNFSLLSRPSPLQKKKAYNAGFFLLLLYFLISLNTSAMSMSYMCFSIRVTMLL